MANPLVSIVTAAYRSRPEYLEAALRSALAQTWAHIDVLVSDDSPDDRLRAVAERLGDPRVRYQRNVPALGPAGNHWRCFREAEGEYIATLNHDDLFEPTFVERLVAPLVQDSTVALAFCDHWIIDSTGRRLVEETESNSVRYGRASMRGGRQWPSAGLVVSQAIPMAMGSVVRSASLPSALPDNAGPAYDLWLSYLLCRDGAAAYYVPERLSSWRAHTENQTSQGAVAWSLGSAECWDAIADDPEWGDFREIAREKAAAGYFSCAKAAWASAQPAATLAFALRSLRARPTMRGAVACFLPLVPSRFARQVDR